MKNDTVNLTNKLVEEYKPNPFTAEDKPGKLYVKYRGVEQSGSSSGS